jgi:hypothetical protein
VETFEVKKSMNLPCPTRVCGDFRELKKIHEPTLSHTIYGDFRKLRIP